MISSACSIDEFRETTAGRGALDVLRYAEQECADAEALGSTSYVNHLRTLIAELHCNPEYEIKTDTRDDGTRTRTLKVLTPEEQTQREAHNVLAEGLTTDTRHAIALAVGRLFGLKLATPAEQEAATAELMEGRAPTKLKANRIGEVDLLLGVKEFINIGPSIPDPEAILKAAYRLRWEFVRMDAGWAERKRAQYPEEISADTLEIEVGTDLATARFLEGLTPEQRKLQVLKFQGYSPKECAELLGWTPRTVGKVWRSLASDRVDGGTLRAELVFWAVARHRQASDKRASIE